MFFDRYKKSQFIVDVPMNESEIVYFNTRTNAVLVVNKEVGDRFALSTWTPSEKERWLAGGFLIECDFDEKKDLYEKFKEAKNAEGLSLIICPTLGCNLRCGYCYEGSQGEIELMNDAVADDIVEFVKKGGYKALTLTWYGGEPLLAADRVIGLQTRLNSVTKVVSSSMITNGVLLTPTVFKSLVDAGVRKFQITVDGTAEFHDTRRITPTKGGTFNKIITNIKNINASPDFYSIRVNLDKSNADSYLKLMDYFSEDEILKKYLGVIYPAQVTNWTSLPNKWQDYCFTDEEYNKFYFDIADEVYNIYGFNMVRLPEARSMHCGSCAKNSFVVGPKGELYKCWISVGTSMCTVGNISDPNKDFNIAESDFWNNWDISNMDICSDCKFLPLCMGGCAAFIHVGNRKIGEQCIQIKDNLNEIISRAFREEINGN